MIAFTDDTTKPSRINRKKKRRWKIIDLIKSGLTDCYMAAILTPLSTHLEAGLRNPHKAKKGHYQTWFFCTHQKLISILLWWGFIEQPLKRLAAPWRYCELDNIPATQTLAIMGGGLSLLQGITA